LFSRSNSVRADTFAAVVGRPARNCAIAARAAYRAAGTLDHLTVFPGAPDSATNSAVEWLVKTAVSHQLTADG
jgi:hypothetical protein